MNHHQSFTTKCIRTLFFRNHGDERIRFISQYPFRIHSNNNVRIVEIIIFKLQ